MRNESIPLEHSIYFCSEIFTLKFHYVETEISNVFTLGLDTLCRHNFGHNAIVGASSIMPGEHNGHFFQDKENDNEKNSNISITVLRNAYVYFQVLLVRSNTFKGLIATFSVLLHHCFSRLGC